MKEYQVIISYGKYYTLRERKEILEIFLRDIQNQIDDEIRQNADG